MHRETEREGFFHAAVLSHNIGSAQPVIDRDGSLSWHSSHISSSSSSISTTYSSNQSGTVNAAVDLMAREHQALADIVPVDPQVGKGSAHSLRLSLLSQLIQKGHTCVLGAYTSKCGLLDPSVQKLVQQRTGSALLYMANVLSNTPPLWARSDPATLALLIQLLQERGEAMLQPDPAQQPQGDGPTSQQEQQGMYTDDDGEEQGCVDDDDDDDDGEAEAAAAAATAASAGGGDAVEGGGGAATAKRSRRGRGRGK